METNEETSGADETPAAPQTPPPKQGKFKRSWEIAKTSWHLTTHDKELYWFPVFSGLAVILSYGIGALIIFLGGGFDERITLLYIIVGVVFVFFVPVVLITMSTASLMFGLRQRLDGGDPTVGSAIDGMRASMGPVIKWGLLSATVSLLINLAKAAIEAVTKSKALAELITGIAGFAWSIISFFALPVALFEKVGPKKAIKRSISLLKSTWGEALILSLGIGVVIFIGFLIIGVPIAGVFALAIVVGGGAPLFVLAGVVTVLLVTALIIVSGVLSAAYKVCLYIYASTGNIPEPFAGKGIEHAFAKKKKPFSRKNKK